MTYRNGPESLTPRELEIALLIGRGMRNAEIGQALGISECTVRNHVQNGMDKLGIHSRSALAVHADRKGTMARMNEWAGEWYGVTAPRANAEQQQPAQTAEKSHNEKESEGNL